MAGEIKEIVLNVLLGDWDYQYKNEIADLITLVIIFMFAIFVYNLIRWILKLSRGFYD